MARTYRVTRAAKSGSGGETVLARGLDTMAEAAEIALRLFTLQEQELGGDAEFYGEVE